MIMAQSQYPGIGRLAYVLLTVILCPLLLLLGWFATLWIAASQAVDQGNDSLNSLWHLLHIPITLLFVVVWIYVEVLRLRNLGMSGWWYLGKLLPFINLWIFWRTLACPPGYDDHRRLDLPGKIITGLMILPLLLPVILLIISLIHGIVSGI